MPNPDIYFGEDKGLPLEVVDARLATGEYAEVDISSDNFFSAVLRRLDRDLFPEQPQDRLFRGWRNSDVQVGVYLPPETEAVPELMQLYSRKISALYQRYFHQDDRLAVAAWSAWILRDIHPKQDGNGRLAKSIMGWFYPSKQFFGHQSEDWVLAIRTQERKWLHRAALVQNAPVPDKQLKMSRSFTTIPLLDDLLSFYRPTIKPGVPQDIPAIGLRDDITNTSIDDNKRFHPHGISSDALEYVMRYISSAPNRR